MACTRIPAIADSSTCSGHLFIFFPLGPVSRLHILTLNFGPGAESGPEGRHRLKKSSREKQAGRTTMGGGVFGAVGGGAREAGRAGCTA